MQTSDFAVDLVYLWVDGDDPAWRAKRNQYIGGSTIQTAEVVGDARWRNIDELRYSLRSVEKYAPWINHIFIVTDNQCPKWLNRNHPKITIVDHKDIFPHEVLPTFNSCAMEACLHKIPNLSEHFIFGNDDTLFTKPIHRSTFFNEDGRPIVRLMRFDREKALRRGHYHKMIRRMQDLIEADFGEQIYLAPHHNFDAYLRSDYEYCIKNLHSEAWQNILYHRFRHNEDMHRSYISYYMIATGHAVMRKVGRYNNIEGIFNKIKATLTNRFANDSRCINNYSRNYTAQMRKYNPIMICVNDSERATAEDGQRMAKFLQELFPDKCGFEL